MNKGAVNMRFGKPAAYVLAFACVLALPGCETPPVSGAAAAPPSAELQFLDFQGFDRDLTASLSAPLPSVQVAFLDRVTPSAMPNRLQTWMAAVESSGGKVQVEPPKTGMTPKSPALLISAITSLWSASKMAKELSERKQFEAAKAYDARIVLKLDGKGEAVVDKIVFVQRTKQPN